MIRKAQYISLAVFLFSFSTCSSCAEKFNHMQIPESEAGQEDPRAEKSDMEESGIEESDQEKSGSSSSSWTDS